MRILLHVCCGPCAVCTRCSSSGQQGHEVTGFFYNPNIHPYQEFRRRLDAVRQFAQETGCPVEIDEHYGLTEYLRQVVFHEQERCPRCYEMRLARTAETAVAGKFRRLYHHPALLEIPEPPSAHRPMRAVGRAGYGIGLYYEDFRLGWQQGIDESIRMGLYRQPYCGCIYSEQERYDKQLRKQTAR